MKVRIEIDCSAEEARAFLGMPDLRAAHEAMARGVEERIGEAMKAFDAEAMAKAWMPGGLEGFEAMRKAFGDAFGKGTGGRRE